MAGQRKNMKNKKNGFTHTLSSKVSGFTLIELLVVIAIIGILATVIMISVSGSKDKAKVSAFKSEVGNLSKAFIIACQDGRLGPLNLPISANVKTFTPTIGASVDITDACFINSNIFEVKITATNGSNCTSIITQDGTTYTGC